MTIGYRMWYDGVGGTEDDYRQPQGARPHAPGARGEARRALGDHLALGERQAHAAGPARAARPARPGRRGTCEQEGEEVMTTAAIYSRVSTFMQKAKGYGLAAQDEDCDRAVARL